MKQFQKPKNNGSNAQPQACLNQNLTPTPTSPDNMDSLVKKPMRYLHLNGQELEPRYITPSRNVDKYFVTHAISPFEFYMVYEADKTGPFVMSEQNATMQNFYNKTEDFNAKYTVKNVEEFKCYMVQDKSSGIWMRARILTYDAVTHKAFVYYCDTSQKQYVHCNTLRDLNKEFLSQPMPVFRCHLHDIAPVDKDYFWPLETLDMFSKFVFQKSILALPMTWTRTTVCGSVDVIYDLGVLLFEPDFLECSLNSYFVQQNLAICIGFSSAHPKMMLRSDIVQDKIDESTRPVNNTQSSELPSKMETIDKKLLLSVDDAIPAFVQRQLVHISMSSVRGVDGIFVHWENKETELQKMENELSKEYAAVKTPFTELKLGDFVCCVTLKGKRKTYCRGVISRILPSQDIAVILVDHGNEVTTHFEMISLLSERFLSTPSFVTRLHLHSIRPLPLAHKSWSKETSIEFKIFILEHEKDNPYYFAYRPEKSKVVNYEDIRQRLKYDPLTKNWEPIPVNEYRIGSDQSLFHLKSHPLLASFFTSMPAEIMIQLDVESDELWNFAHITDYVVLYELGELIEPLFDTTKYYDVLKAAYDTYDDVPNNDDN